MARNTPGQADFLGLTHHPEVLAAARTALLEQGLRGEAETSEAAQGLAALTGCPHIVVFPTEWAAWYAAMASLVRRRDHVLIDERVQSGLREAARCVTDKLHDVPHGDLAAVHGMLHAIRAAEPLAGLFVVTEALFALEGSRADLGALAQICRSERAALVVDVSHDLGAHGTGGTGTIGHHGLLGGVDLVVGGLRNTFATHCGFLGSLFPSVAHFVRTFGTGHCLSTGPTPLEVATLTASLRIVASEEGEQRRARLRQHAARLRGILESVGRVCPGEPAGFVPVFVGDEAIARLAHSLLEDRGHPLHLVEHPTVPRHAARLRVDLCADATPEQVDDCGHAIADCLHEATLLRAGVARLSL